MARRDIHTSLLDRRAWFKRMMHNINSDDPQAMDQGTIVAVYLSSDREVMVTIEIDEDRQETVSTFSVNVNWVTLIPKNYGAS